jgi:hypothetical protein
MAMKAYESGPETRRAISYIIASYQFVVRMSLLAAGMNLLQFLMWNL